MKRVLLALIFSCFAARAEQALRGIVLDAVGGEPLARVQVQLAGQPYSAVTDSGGRFELAGVPPGDYLLQVSTVGYRTIKKAFSLGAGETKEFEIRLSPDTLRQTESVQVAAGPFDVVRQESPSQLTLSGTEAKNLSSVLADDPLRAVQAMPGVASDDDFNSRFSLRGADFHRIGLYLDDVLMHSPFHTVQGTEGTGSITIFNGDMLEDLALYPGVMPARLADRTAGALDVHTREGSRTGPALRINAGAAAAGIMAEGPLGKAHRGSWLAGARKSYLQYLLRRSSLDPSVAFGFFDSQGRLSYDLARGHHASLHVIDGFSDLDRSSARARLGANSMMNGVYHFTLANLAWRYTRGENLLVTNRLAFVREKFQNRNLEQSTLGAEHYGEWVWNANATWMWTARSPLDGGGVVRRVRDAGLSNFYQFNPRAVRVLDDYRGHTLRQGGYVQQSWSAAGGKVHLAAGGRWDRQSLSGAATVTPYASLGFAPLAATRLELAWGQYAQFPEVQWLLQRIGTRALLPERATQYVAAIEQRMGERTRVRLEVYEREDRDLSFQPLADPRILGGRIFNPPLNPPLRNVLRGYARGVELFLQRRSANRLSGWISYALGYTRLRDGVTGARFVSDQDQRHTVNVYGSYRFSPTVNLSMKWLYGSGFPYPGYLRKAGTTYFLADQRNTLRLDPYQRTDVRINKAWQRDRWKVTLYGEVVNLLNRTNYRFDVLDGYNGRTGSIALTLNKMFPILPSAGVMLER